MSATTTHGRATISVNAKNARRESTKIFFTPNLPSSPAGEEGITNPGASDATLTDRGLLHLSDSSFQRGELGTGGPCTISGVLHLRFPRMRAKCVQVVFVGTECTQWNKEDNRYRGSRTFFERGMVVWESPRGYSDISHLDLPFSIDITDAANRLPSTLITPHGSVEYSLCAVIQRRRTLIPWSSSTKVAEKATVLTRRHVRTSESNTHDGGFRWECPEAEAVQRHGGIGCLFTIPTCELSKGVAYPLAFRFRHHEPSNTKIQSVNVSVKTCAEYRAGIAPKSEAKSVKFYSFNAELHGGGVTQVSATESRCAIAVQLSEDLAPSLCTGLITVRHFLRVKVALSSGPGVKVQHVTFEKEVFVGNFDDDDKSGEGKDPTELSEG